MRSLVHRFLQDDGGATAIEYGLICGLIFLAILGSLTAFGGATDGLFATAMGKVTAALRG